MYNHKEIEKKWQKYWQENNTFKTSNTSLKPKYYVLDMFPYPSGAGLHVGHPEGMTANDIVARYKHAKGHNVLHPMGWDAFGLPAENYAIKTGTHPRITTDENIANFRRQIQSLGFSYDWEREIDTTDPEYYKWTQWIFLKMFENGLAYEQDLPINYCPSCKTGLANEEVLNDFSCERCGTTVEKKKIRQWVLAITKYAERLLKDVDDLDWPEGIKEMQRNWIGKSEGCEFELKKAPHPPTGTSPQEEEEISIRVYTTRIDTVFGMTYAVLAPDHKDVSTFITSENKVECERYILEASQKSDQDRTQDDKEKTGVFTGSYVINPFNGEKVELWIADYVLGNYGTGAVMAVPAHDVRDFEFAIKYDLEIIQSIAPYIELKGKSTPKSNDDIEKEHTVTAVIEHWGNGKYAVLEFNNGEYGLVGGCVDKLENKEECILREIGEEIGYLNGEIKEIIFENAYGRGYKERKKSERESLDKVFYVKLKNGEKCNFGEDEGIKNIKWFSEKEFKKISLLTHHKFFVNQFFKENKAFTDLGILVNSGEFSGLKSKQAQSKMIDFSEKQGFGSKKVNYKLRDWLFSRQRYWGEPIPLVHCNDCGIVGEKEENLPILLPETDNFEPSGDGTSPLTKIESFVNCKCPKCGGKAKRETNTMPQWGGSCWYYLRFMDVKNSETLVGNQVEKYWGQVDSYVGGAEHAVLHLLYARFWHKFLFDIGVVSHSEPFYRLRNQGLIQSYIYVTEKGKSIHMDLVEEKAGECFHKETGEILEKKIGKMSKSLGNVINPDEIVEKYGADTLRMYEMYMAEFKDAAPWDTSSIVGVKRFLDKVSSLFLEGNPREAKSDDGAMKTLHKTIKKVEKDIENYKFNTAIAQMIICLNEGEPKDAEKKKQWREIFIILLHPFAPHIAEESWKVMNEEKIEKKYTKMHLVSGNAGKLERLQKIFKKIDKNVTVEKYLEMVDVEETGETPMECAIQKLEPYKGKGISEPIIATDTAVYFDGEESDPTHVKRRALEVKGLKEEDVTQEEIAEVMVEYYKNLAEKSGGEKEFYYVDSWAVLFPNGKIKEFEYRREYILTTEERGERNAYFPMRPLYKSKITEKYAVDTSEEDFYEEFECQTEAIEELFRYGKQSIFFTQWPIYDKKLVIDNEITIGVQVLGKLRGEILIGIDEDKESVLKKARENENVVKWLDGKTLVKEIYVPGKIVNLVVK